MHQEQCLLRRPPPGQGGNSVLLASDSKHMVVLDCKGAFRSPTSRRVEKEVQSPRKANRAKSLPTRQTPASPRLTNTSRRDPIFGSYKRRELWPRPFLYPFVPGMDGRSVVGLDSWMLPSCLHALYRKSRSRSRKLLKLDASGFSGVLHVRCFNQSPRDWATRYFACRYNVLFEYLSETEKDPIGVMPLNEFRVSLQGDSVFLVTYGGDSSSESSSSLTSSYSRPPVALELQATFVEDETILEPEAIFQGLMKARSLSLSDLYLVRKDVVYVNDYSNLIQAKRADKGNRNGDKCTLQIINKAKYREMRMVERNFPEKLSIHGFLCEKDTEHSVLQVLDVFETLDLLIVEYERFSPPNLPGNVHNELKEEMVARVVSQLLDALQVMHTNNICYNGLSTKSVVMTPKGNARLWRFDSAVVTSEEGLIYEQAEKNKFAAPETVNNSAGYTLQADLYSLGALTHFFLISTPPKVPDMDTAELREGENVSDEASDFMMQLLQSNPQRRMSLSQAKRHPWVLKHTFHTDKGGFCSIT